MRTLKSMLSFFHSKDRTYFDGRRKVKKGKMGSVRMIELLLKFE